MILHTCNLFPKIQARASSSFIVVLSPASLRGRPQIRPRPLLFLFQWEREGKTPSKSPSQKAVPHTSHHGCAIITYVLSVLSAGAEMTSNSTFDKHVQCICVQFDYVELAQINIYYINSCIVYRGYSATCMNRKILIQWRNSLV